MSPPRICDLGAVEDTQVAAERVRALGFTCVAFDQRIMGDVCPLLGSGLHGLINVDLTEMASQSFVEEHPDWFAFRRDSYCGPVVDPRNPPLLEGRRIARFYAEPTEFQKHWREQLLGLLRDGVRGFRVQNPGRLPAELWRSLIAEIREDAKEALFVADIAGLTREELVSLKGCGFNYCLSSLAWWDFREPWLIEEYAAASTIAPVVATVGSTLAKIPAGAAARRGRYAVAAVAGCGVWMPFEFAAESDIDACIVATNELIASDGIVATCGALSRRGEALVRTAEADQRLAREALIAVVNPTDLIRPISPALDDWDIAEDAPLLPHEVRLMRATRRPPINLAPPEPTTDAPRIVIANVSPSVEDGRYIVKRIVGDSVTIEADIFADGHPLLAAELIFRDQRIRMRLVQNDRWQAKVTLDRVGRHEFAIEAWIDRYGGFARDLAKKREAGRDIAFDLREGAAMVQDVLGVCANDLAILLAPETIEAMHRIEPRPFLVRSETYPIDADRPGAVFASWYELFPRSQTNDVQRHGTFRDVIARLPAIRAMGFDVLYLPPVHPIGRTNRKGRNNALNAKPGDPGSVYAIGACEGGHDKPHPQLGTFADFRALVAAARAGGLEIALDFAVQCSPDHPWLKEHPGWFDWRADGSIKYAENPPKLYEDIVNVDFYAQEAVPGLWLALRDVVKLWVGEGVRIFRVDNPHTKPFAFWEWLIASIRAVDPDVIFLAEAFTRPSIMYHLAKLGFTQSYTYFTWRNSKDELTQYMRELNEAPVRDFFRPHFFANTPDINPYFLQTSGRPGFLIRAALAATLSGLWGIYSGFELCEAAALPGREEYVDSEKYEIKPRDWNAQDNIINEIGILNRLRNAYPALQTHLGVAFYNAFNPNILYYAKHAPNETSRVLVAVSLNPHGAEECELEIPLWEWGLPDGGAVFAEDLLTGRHFVWRGKIQHLRLEPDMPYRLWRVCPAENQ
jgi:starch synthase (maltosyl-transferring)